jgi:tetratricopeptide (TPR) repeat protein
MKRLVYTIIIIILGYQGKAETIEKRVRIWEAPLKLPTYLVGAPEKSPSFMQNFAYQRAKRCIYPYAMDDNITNERVEKEYKALYLENEYVKVCMLPELGGRILYAIDKTNNYNIFYHQTVIKPANIGMPGAWISGGVEWNTFHHHRTTSQMPVDYKLVENSDGSKTIWVGETEFRTRMKWSIGVTLHPGKSYMEISGRLNNATQNKNSFLYWSNVATHTNKDYQIIFPGSTDFGVMHAKNSFCKWPITSEVYNGLCHYKNGVDASWWKNNHDLVSIFAYDLKDGFLAGYDYGRDAGTMLVGNVNIVKGGKFFLWGPGAYGKKWDSEILTESDGPYVELMVGAYSDNQPDYSWLNPYEVKAFTKYWYGIRDLGGAKAGNVRASLNMEFKSGDNLFLAANTTEVVEKAVITVTTLDGEVLYKKETDVAPDKPFKAEVKLSVVITDPTKVKLTLSDVTGKEILSYHQIKKDSELPLPETVKPLLKPGDIKTTEELYLTGLRNTQFHNAFVNPLDYFEEALKRDPYDLRCNTQLGIHYREQGDYDKAAMYLRKAIKRLTKDYTRPRDCEALYHLGLILKEQGKQKAAIDTLYRAAWDFNFMSPAYFQLAQISAQNNDYKEALTQLGESLSANARNLNAMNLKATVLRSSGNFKGAESMVEEVLSLDPLNTYAMNEMYRIAEDKNGANVNLNFEKLTRSMRDQPEAYLELAVAYLNNGFIAEAEKILQRANQSSDEKLKNYPTIKYYLGYISDISGDKSAAKKYFDQAVSLPVEYCFPFRLETVKVYKTALQYLPEAANTYYFMGSLLFDKQPDQAMEYWQQAVKYKPDFAMAYRNIGWGYRYHVKDLAKAISNYEKAVNLDNTQAIWFTELDQITESAGVDVRKRCEILVKNHETVKNRYESFVREIRMLINIGEYDKAINYLTTHYFSRQEGVDNLHDIYTDACLLKGINLMENGKSAEAYKFFRMADEYPENQNYARWEIYPRNAQIYCLTGKSLEKLGNKKEALKYYKLASGTDTKGDFYGYTKGAQYDYYKALAMKKIDSKADITPLLEDMIKKGNDAITDYVELFFVSFGPGKTVNEVNSEAYYTIGLGYLGRGDVPKAKEYFENSIRMKPDHLWAGYFLANLKQ